MQRPNVETVTAARDGRANELRQRLLAGVRTGDEGFGGALKVWARLFGRRTVDPFLQAGIRMYRASFGSGARTVPSFYGRRLRALMRADGAPVTFTDPTVVAGGGVNIFVNRHVAIRPDVEATVVLRDGAATSSRCDSCSSEPFGLA